MGDGGLWGRHVSIMERKTYIPYFEPIGHLYHDDTGRALDSVTTIIKLELGLYQYGDGSAAERGTAVHRACQYYDEKDLDESSLPENVKPYLNQYKQALGTYKIVVLQNELMRFHPVYLYAGTLDKIVEINGNRGILDLKTGVECIDHKFQTAAYLDMVKHEHEGILLKRWGLYLTPDSHKLIEHADKNDFREFLVLYSSHNIKVKYGFRKRRESDE